jgi:signal transduction histidine kinase
VDDLDAAASTALERHLAEAGLGSLVAVPIADDGGRRGILLLAAPPPAAFAPHHRAVAREAADLLGQALDPPGADEQDDETDDALRSALLANVHHELRTPLTSIIGFAEVLCQKEEGAAGRFADLIARSGRRLETTFDNLLTLSRLEAGTMPIEPEPLSVAAEGRAVVAAFEERAREAEVALEWNGPEGALDAVLDADGLRDVLRHLLDNAVAFTEAGGTVTVRLGAAGDEVVLAVADTGIGMDPARVSELTVPFRQASTGLDRTHEGCGLGLSIVQGWVTALAGTVDVETALGAGTTVTVRLPRAPAAGGP